MNFESPKWRRGALEKEVVLIDEETAARRRRRNIILAILAVLVLLVIAYMMFGRGGGDGYPRSAPSGTPVLVQGVRTRLVGRVSMDLLTVDLGPVPEADVGSEVVLWGEGLAVDDIAHRAGTIGYELLCAVAPRVPVVEVG